MGLNETLDRLSREREQKEYRDTLTLSADTSRRQQIRIYAERIFFERMLKDINNGMSAPKIEALIDRSIMIAEILTDKILTDNINNQ